MTGWLAICIFLWLLLCLSLLRLRSPRAPMTRYEAIQRLRDAEAARRDAEEGRF